MSGGAFEREDRSILAEVHIRGERIRYFHSMTMAFKYARERAQDGAVVYVVDGPGCVWQIMRVPWVHDG